MTNLRTVLLVLFFLGLVALEIAHGVSRIDSIRENREQEIRNDIVRRHSELVDALRPILVRSRNHTLYLAGLADVIRLLATEAEGPAPPRVERDLTRYLVFNEEVDRVRVVDRDGRERFRGQRVAGRTDIEVVPAERLQRPLEASGDDLDIPDEGARLEEITTAQVLLLPGAERSGRVAMSGVEIESREGSWTSREVIHFTTDVADDENRPVGRVILTVHASPLLARVRGFSPLPGCETVLIDDDGNYLAHPDRDRELAARGGSVQRDHPTAAPSLLRGDPTVEDADALYLSTRVAKSPPWLLVSRIPSSSLSQVAVAGIRGEYAWIILTMVGITLLLFAAMLFFMRLSRREVQLREQQLYLARERQMERQLAMAERLSSLGQVTAGVAHEINNPLEGIGNYLSLLERDNLTSEKRMRFLSLVRHGFDRIRDIVRDLSSFARPEATGDSADLALVVRQAVRLVQYNKEFREVEIALVGLDQPLVVPGDPGRLEQVFMNLLINAGRALEGRGHIWIRARRRAGKEGDNVEVQVEDDGPGIAPESLDRIFDPFFTTREGSGLGLSVSYGIVRVHGGTITAENRPEGGARISICLPAGAPVLADERS